MDRALSPEPMELDFGDDHVPSLWEGVGAVRPHSLGEGGLPDSPGDAQVGRAVAPQPSAGDHRGPPAAAGLNGLDDSQGDPFLDLDV